MLTQEKGLSASIKNTIILLFVPPELCISTVFGFSWDHCKSREKIKTMPMQNFGGTNKEYCGIFDTC